MGSSAINIDQKDDQQGQQPCRLLISGLGLLGGSVAMAARERGFASEVASVVRPGRNHDLAVKKGVVDFYTDSLEEGCQWADIIILASPVESIRHNLPTIMGAIKPGTIVTDVGSTKGTIVAAADSLSSLGHFVGSHPMAGSHLTGWEHGSSDFFQGSTAYITVTDKSSLRAVSHVAALWRALGCRILITTPERHDRLASLVSHTPHMTAMALVELVEKSAEDPQFLKEIIGPGFLDTTRIAMGSPVVWEEIAQENREAIANCLEALSSQLQALAKDIRGDQKYLYKNLESAAKLREELNKK